MAPGRQAFVPFLSTQVAMRLLTSSSQAHYAQVRNPPFLPSANAATLPCSLLHPSPRPHAAPLLLLLLPHAKGDWVANVRHGYGRYVFDSGDVYSGQWEGDKRTGHGTLYYRSGDIFVGNFVRDRREGMGTLFLMSRQKK